MKNRKRSAWILAILLALFYIGFYLFFSTDRKPQKDEPQEEVVVFLDPSLTEGPGYLNL